MKKKITAVLLAVLMLSGCGKSEEDIKKIDDLKTRVTSVDTELASMYGKLEDMHETGLIDDEFYNEFMAIDTDADECMSYADKSGASADKLEEMVTKLEGDFAACKKRLDEINGENDEKLMQELIVLQFAVKEQGGLMKRALESGKITQEDYDEFIVLQKQVDKYNAETDLKYNDEFKAKIAEMRSRLTALASKAGADNSLIDRLVGTDDTEGAEETPRGKEGTDIKQSEKSEIEPETEAATATEGNSVQSTKQAEIPQNIQKLIDDYMALQEFASAKQAAGEIDDLAYIDVLGVGVELSYLKEAVEKDGVTENNTYTMQDIKASLYEKAQKLGYEKAEVFK